MWEIARILNATVIGISESKLENTLDDSKIPIEGYSVTSRDPNKGGGIIVYYVRGNVCCSTKNSISSEIEDIFIKHFFQKTRPINVSKSNFKQFKHT